MSRATWESRLKEFAAFRLRDFHPLRLAFPGYSAKLQISDSSTQTAPGSIRDPTTPVAQRVQALTCQPVGAFPFSLATTGGITSFSFPEGTKMFQFPSFASTWLCIHQGISRHYSGWVSPFGNPRVYAYKRLTEAYRSSSRPSSDP